MSVLTDLIYGGSHAVAGLTEGAVNDAIAKHGADKAIAFPDRHCERREAGTRRQPH